MMLKKVKLKDNMRLLICMLALVIALSGCSRSRSSEVTSPATVASKLPVSDSSVAASSSISEAYVHKPVDEIPGYHAYKAPLIEYVKGDVSFFDDYSDDILKNQIAEGNIFATKEYTFTTSQRAHTLIALKVDIDPLNQYHFIGLQKEDRFIFAFCGFSDHEIAIVDLDGDADEEIIVHSEIPACSREGPYFVTEIYKWDGNAFEPIFSFRDTGFRFIYRGDDDCSIINLYTGSVTPIQTDELTVPGREDAIVLGEEFPYDQQLDHLQTQFLLFEPNDIDGDGICEIVIRQRFAMERKTYFSYVGDAYSAIKYDPVSKDFRVVRSAFEQIMQKHGEQVIEDDSHWYRPDIMGGR